MSTLKLLDSVQERAKLHVNDDRVFSVNDLLEHRCNVGCVLVLYCHYNRFCSSEISGAISGKFKSRRSLVGSVLAY